MKHLHACSLFFNNRSANRRAVSAAPGLLRSVLKVSPGLLLLLVALHLPALLSAQCDNPITGKSAVIDQTGTGALCLLCGTANIQNLIDGDLSNFVSFNAPVTLLTATPIVSIKDMGIDYASGTRVGYVIEPQGGLISSSLLASFQIRTYLDNVLKQTVTGASLTQTAMGGNGNKTRISFVTSQAYDEVELVLVSTLGLLSSVRVYYAYEEPASGCNYACMLSVTDKNYNASINPALTGITGLCIGCSVTNTANIQDNDTLNSGRIFMLAAVGASGAISVKAGQTIPAGYDAGFAISDGTGLLGLLGTSLLGNTQIITYLAGVGQDTLNAGSGLANVTLLGGSSSINLVSFKTVSPFDEIRIKIASFVGVAVDVDVWFPFVRPDTDSDGAPNCVDKCAGFPDYLDADGDGIPDGCDAAVCMLNAGLDKTVCPPTATAQLPAATAGQSWSAVPGNPAAASISSAGAVSGMSAEGTYLFVLTQGSCHDTVAIDRYQATLAAACNNPIVGNGVIVDQVGNTGGICLLCGGGGTIIDGNLGDYATYTVGVGVFVATSIISVKDTSQVYPAGRRTGFVVEPQGGLLNAGALGTLQIKTYLNNVLRETATTGNSLLQAGVLAGNGNKQRLSFVTTMSYDEIELVVTSVLGALTTLRVYYAFEEPAAGCPAIIGGELCSDALTYSNSDYCTGINYAHTGITGVCVACSVNNVGNLIDGNQTNFSTINLTIGVGAAGSVSVLTRQVFPAGYIAGFAIGSTANLLDASVLGALTIRTYLNGFPQDQLVASSGLVNASVLNPASGLSQLSITTTLPFDEIQLQVDGLVSALSTTNVYYAFVRTDSDADGSPDCADKCCGGNDNFDTNGNGVPNSCDPVPVAVNDTYSIVEDTPTNLNVVANDNFGGDGPAAMAITITSAPAHGTATVNNNGTPNNPADDFITYTPAANYNGPDMLTYRICDSNGDCVTGSVTLTVTAVNDAPLANNDNATTPEDMVVTVSVLANDTDVDGNINPASVTVTVAPLHGATSVNPATGAITYTPAANFNGMDSLTYQVCDTGTPILCSTAKVYFNVTAVNDAPVAVNDNATTPEDTPLTVNVLGNDSDVENGLNPASVTVTVAPLHGTTSVNPATGAITYTPAANFNGMDSLTYQVCDAGTPVLCSTAKVYFNATAVNDAPVANNDNASTGEDTPVIVNVLANDTDAEGNINPASVTVLSGPAHGTATVNPVNGAITYTPALGFNGYDSLHYVVCDAALACDTALVALTVNAPPSECNDPITGKGTVVDKTGTGALCLLCGNTDVKNLVDSTLYNYAAFNAPVSVLSATSIVSIKDIATDYPVGIRTGYVIEPIGGLLNSSLLGSFQIRTYLNNTLQQTVNGGSLDVQAIGTLRRLSFVSALPFDEVELVLVSTLGALSSVRVYYAFVEPAAGCDYECVDAVVPPDFASSINPVRTGIGGLLCLLCSVNNTANVVDADTTNFGTIILTAGIGVNGSISVKANQLIHAGYDAGFAVSDGGGLLGLLNANVLGNTDLLTYRNDSLQETVALNSATANVVLLGGSNAINLLSFKTTKNFDEIRIRVNSLLGVAINLRVHFAFVRPDDDSDGFANCVDKCPGFADGLDFDGDGVPDGCDEPVCMLNAGLDQSVCPPTPTAQLQAAGMGQTWSALPGNPAAATVNSAGMVNGLTIEGSYGFVLSQGTCHDTVYINYFEATLASECNNPIVANNVIIDQIGLTGGICLLCGGGTGGQEVIDGNLSNYAQYTIGVGVLTATSIISVKDTAQVYPAAYRTGFVVEPVGGLLNASALNNLQIRTYLNNTLQQTATVSSGLLTANVIVGNGNKQRLSFVTNQPFDEVELVATSLLGAITTLRVYYAFEEPSSCPADPGLACTQVLSVTNSDFCGQLAYDRTGITGVCALCSIDNLSNVIDNDENSFAKINLTVGVGATARIAVHTRQVIPAGYSAGFAILTPANLLSAPVLGAIRLRTYLNGALREDIVATSGVVSAGVLNDSSGLSQLSFVSTQSFDEIQLQVEGTVLTLSDINVYYAFVRSDSDGDGSPDCADKCCGGNDNMDSNGNGQPDACDALPVAVNDNISTPEDIPVVIPVLGNDSFGADGAGTGPIQLIGTATHGTATVNNNGTPNDPIDDTVLYTPAPNYNGPDTLRYRICDSSGDCDTAFVFITVTPVNDPPVVPDQTVTTPEDTPVTVCVPISDVDNSTFTVTSVCTPDGGIISGLTNPATSQYCVTYTPTANYTGPDTLCIAICDASGACDTSRIFITVTPVNDPPVVPDPGVTTPEDIPVTFCVPITDADDTTFTVTSICMPAGGMISGLTNPATSQFCLTYTPNPNFNGPDTICIMVCDPSGACDTALIPVSVTPVNDVPLAQNDIISTTQGLPVIIPVLNNDTDPDGNLDTSSVTVVITPGNGTATPNPATGTITYTPAPNFFGTDTILYAVCDQGTPVLCDSALVIVTVSAANVKLTVKMRLQGALYNSPDTLMRDNLRSLGRIPKKEPYTGLAPSFIHANGGGGEMVMDSATVFANYGPNSMVDWVFIELRDSANPALVVATRSALLQRDGDVVDVDGVSNLVFNSTVPKSYYVAIRHRNHLGSMTANPIPLTPAGTTVDFTNLSTALWDDGTNLNGLEQVTVNGKYALWAGNVNKNKSVVFAGQSNDKDPIFNQIDQAPGNFLHSQSYVFNGYHLGDVNLDGKAIFAGQNNDVDFIFNNVDGHPRNFLHSQTFVIREQLATQ